MCYISAVMQSGIQKPLDYWQSEINRKAFEQQMRRAKAYDVETGQPDCENDEKKKALQAIADQLGVKISFPEGT